MLTPVSKLFPGAQLSQHAATPSAKAELGPDGARAAGLGAPDHLRRRHGESDPARRTPLATETYRAGGPRPPDPAARNRDHQRVEPLIEALSRLDALEAGLRDAPLVVVSAGEGAAELRLGGAALRPAPGAALERSGLRALSALLGRSDARDGLLFGLGTGDDRLVMAHGATALIRLSERVARDQGDAVADRPGPAEIALAFAGGARLTVETAPDAALTLLFADGARLPISAAPLPPGRAGVDLRL